MRQVDLSGAAHLVLNSGVRYLDPAPAVFEHEHRSHRPPDRALGLAVTTGVTALLTVAGLLSLWVAPPSDADLLLVIWALVFGAGFDAAARAVLDNEQVSVPGRLFLLGATLLLIAPLVRAAGQSVVAQVSVVLGTAVALPLGLVHVDPTRTVTTQLRAGSERPTAGSCRSRSPPRTHCPSYRRPWRSSRTASRSRR